MKLKKIITLLILLSACSTSFAQYETKGDGTTYTIKSLASLEDANIIVYEAEAVPGYKATYQSGSSITIAEGDKFKMDDGVNVLFDKNVTFAIKGEADFNLTEGSTFDSAYDITDGDALGSAVRIMSSTKTTFSNCSFSYVGLELMGTGAADISHCQFYNHDGSSAAALYYITAGAAGTITDCHFEYCRKAAIGSAANAAQPMTVKNCSFVKNSTANNNVPQINVTASDKLTIEGCTITGNPQNTMVGGIGISNFYGHAADVVISGCTIEDNRYGIGFVGPASKVRIEKCTLLNNKYETNPMNGGSGISLYDPYKKTNAFITGNHIEGSLWGVTVIGCQYVNLGCVDAGDDYNPGGNVFKDNGNNGVLYDLYNNSTITVYAQNNTWNVSQQTQEAIESVIFHKHDDASLGEVLYWPAAGSTDIRSVRQSSSDVRFFNLQGRQLTGKPSKGIVILNGKKVVY